ncbi:MAG: hypothetical protein K2H61_03445 [Muribaculaceae bacterium]|nr:hypothetical protein [Muribaculaceae bacterium]MDE7393093.1 hypothetical protein [Muribaculaceae bacterium]
MIAAAAIIAAVLLPASCNRSKQYKIGVSQCSKDDWRPKMNAEINREIMMHPDAMVEMFLLPPMDFQNRYGDDDLPSR